MTDCDRVLAALRQGPQTANQLYALHLIAHSRISDLRRKGHGITCVRVPGGSTARPVYVYTLVHDADASLNAADPPEPRLPQTGADSESGALKDAQLTLVNA